MFKIDKIRYLSVDDGLSQSQKHTLIQLEVEGHQSPAQDENYPGDGNSDLSDVSVYIPNGKILNSFRNNFNKNCPITPGEIKLKDPNNSCIGRWNPNRDNNDEGGNLPLNQNFKDFKSIKLDESKQNHLLIEDYPKFSNAVTTLMKANIFKRDVELCGSKFRNTRLFISESLMKIIREFTDVIHPDNFINMFQNVTVCDDNSIVTHMQETVFGMRIKGNPQNISTRIQVVEGTLVKVEYSTNSGTVNHRSNNRIIIESNKELFKATLLLHVLHTDDILLVHDENDPMPLVEELVISDCEISYEVLNHYFAMINFITQFNEIPKENILERKNFMISMSQFILKCAFTDKIENSDTSSKNITKELIINNYNNYILQIKSIMKSLMDNRKHVNIPSYEAERCRTDGPLLVSDFPKAPVPTFPFSSSSFAGY